MSATEPVDPPYGYYDDEDPDDDWYDPDYDRLCSYPCEFCGESEDDDE